MRTVVVRFVDARCRILYCDCRFYRCQPRDAASDAASCINETNKS
ncbi:unnamed protein product [Brassica rapa]|uniref:Uncharacterized protein n=1 Tax=Brassica campestris TaxID=3711 RepID=A0A8D9CSX3_BRACM|nr:unnamed protein product [Brassica rapa]